VAGRDPFGVPLARGIRWRDPFLLVALLAAPVVWLAWWLLGGRISDPAWPMTAVWAFVLPVLIFPILEEIVFRGLLQGWLLSRLGRGGFGPLSFANLIAAVIFAAAHLIHQPPLWAALVFFPALIFGFFRERHDTLGSPILLHVWYNLGWLWLFGGA
jgi:membrane protease YdiL (CAAX protease family)